MIRINANATYIVHAKGGGYAAMTSGQTFLDMLAHPLDAAAGSPQLDADLVGGIWRAAAATAQHAARALPSHRSPRPRHQGRLGEL